MQAQIAPLNEANKAIHDLMCALPEGSIVRLHTGGWLGTIPCSISFAMILHYQKTHGGSSTSDADDDTTLVPQSP